MATPESESPNEQVYQSTGKAPWFKRILFTQVKIPGWLAVLLSVIWSVFTSVPDWKGRVDFWLDAAKASGGYTGEAASVIGSSYFSIALAVTGVLWLALVGEPKRGVLRDPRWVYLGWAVVLIVSMGLVATIINGYIEVRAQEISEGRDNEVINGLLDKLSDANLRIIQIEKANERQKTARHLWRLTEDEKRTVVSLLSLAPKGKVIISPALFDSTGARALAEDIKQVLKEAGYSVPDDFGNTISYSQPGIWLVVSDLNNPPPHAFAIQKAFMSVGVTLPGMPDNDNKLRLDEVNIAISSRPVK